MYNIIIYVLRIKDFYLFIPPETNRSVSGRVILGTLSLYQWRITDCMNIVNINFVQVLIWMNVYWWQADLILDLMQVVQNIELVATFQILPLFSIFFNFSTKASWKAYSVIKLEPVSCWQDVSYSLSFKRRLGELRFSLVCSIFNQWWVVNHCCFEVTR